MEIITSTKNTTVSLARSLAQKKFRQASGLFLVEGVNVLKDMPSGISPVVVLAREDRLEEAKKMFFGRCDILAVSPSVMESISDTKSPYGIAAVCNMPSAEFSLPKKNSLLLDGVSDPGNLGTILRSAAACDFEDIYLLDCADAYSPKVTRASLGGIFKVRLHEIDENQADLLTSSVNCGVLDMGGENILKSKPQTPIMFIAGNEAHGVRNSIKSKVKKSYSLPMQNGIESLNVAVAISVAMYQTIQE